ncbi:MAG: metal-dependent hydrolase [Anaerolineae bacterium]|nr:metal-dependent hydrolase [Anaerolineae bacterium]
MPDWVTHLGTTYIAAHTSLRLNQRLARWVDMRYLLLGALLPDATRFTIILVDILDCPAIPIFTYLIPFHSLLIVALLAGVIALLLPAVGMSSRRVFGLIMPGAALHMLLDDLEGPVGCGSTTFYPFYFGKPFNGWNSEGNFATFLLVVSAIALGVALSQRQLWPAFTLRLTRWRVLAAVFLLGVALVMPLCFRGWMIEQNAYYLGFVANPSAFEGQSVELCFSEVIAAAPVTIEEFDTPFVLQTSEAFTPGEWVSVAGIYQDGVIQPTVLIRHRGFSDVVLSVIAAVVFVLLVVDGRILKRLRWRSKQD